MAARDGQADDLHPRDFAHWLADVERDQDLLRRLVLHVRKSAGKGGKASNRALNQAAAGGELGHADYPATRFTNWMQHRTERLERNEAVNVLKYLVSTFRDLEYGPGSAAHGDPDRLVLVVSRLSEYLCVSPRSLDGLEKRFEAYYWVFRPSVIAPGRYIRGLLGMRWVVADTQPETGTAKGMIRVCEIHRHPGDEGHPMPLLFESYDGFALLKSGVLFLFMSERFAGMDRGPLLITRIHHFLPADRKHPMQLAWGRTLGGSNAAHALPVVFVRVTGEETRHAGASPASPADLEHFSVHAREARVHKPPPSYLASLLGKCEVVDPEALPPTVLAQIEALNREASWFSEHLKRDPAR